NKEVIWRIGPEEVSGNRRDDALARRVSAHDSRNHDGVARRTRTRSGTRGGQREELRRGRIGRRGAKESTEVLDEQIVAHQVDVAWMRQVMRANKDVT